MARPYPRWHHPKSPLSRGRASTLALGSGQGLLSHFAQLLRPLRFDASEPVSRANFVGQLRLNEPVVTEPS